MEYAMYSLVSGFFQSDYFEIHHVILCISNLFLYNMEQYFIIGFSIYKHVICKYR